MSVAHGQSVHWTSFEHLNDSLRFKKKPLMIFVHTEWCKYCKMQENTAYKDVDLSRLLNKNFYCLRLNAEETDDITFLNRIYAFHSYSGYNQLAEIIGKQNGRLIFPTTVLINTDLQVFKRLQGLQKAKSLIQLIQ